ncbi:TetR/AcrR family transcriptional regulator [Nocardia sp. NRRL WC-3656]|uniref:TetR/AcrR family transcriptional regulator n=1 Tax=Nocardia sp. NRRL WC-3656 TaxID=1463824 RepID=UPI0009DF177B|nr:TetR/AcrR family transcriptional regulator [Nocardia sp. NRRL WC-3656]
MPESRTGPSAPASPRPNLAARRKSATRMEIAHTAARLFAERGTAAVTAEQIAAASGVGLRTFYRYCRTKEDAVEPMLSAGASRWLDILGDGPDRLPTIAELETAAIRALNVVDRDELDITRGLLRAMADDSALRAVWFRVNLTGEHALLELLTKLSPDTDPLRLRTLAAAAAGAIRIGLEQWADDDGPVAQPGSVAETSSAAARTDTRASGPAPLVVRCMRELTAGVYAQAPADTTTAS